MGGYTGQAAGEEGRRSSRRSVLWNLGGADEPIAWALRGMDVTREEDVIVVGLADGVEDDGSYYRTPSPSDGPWLLTLATVVEGLVFVPDAGDLIWGGTC